MCLPETVIFFQQEQFLLPLLRLRILENEEIFKPVYLSFH